jgi:hypothetical protein
MNYIGFLFSLVEALLSSHAQGLQVIKSKLATYLV